MDELTYAACSIIESYIDEFESSYVPVHEIGDTPRGQDALVKTVSRNIDRAYNYKLAAKDMHSRANSTGDKHLSRMASRLDKMRDRAYTNTARARERMKRARQ